MQRSIPTYNLPYRLANRFEMKILIATHWCLRTIFLLTYLLLINKKILQLTTNSNIAVFAKLLTVQKEDKTYLLYFRPDF